jgi:hypothetical protein
MALRQVRRSRAAALGSALVAAALVSTSGLVADASSTATPQQVHAHLAYSCRLPSGAHQVVGVTVAGTFPSGAIAGLPVKVTGLRTTVVLPPRAAAGLRRLGVTRVTGRSVLSAAVADDATAVTALWPGQVRKPAPIPTRAPVHLTFSGAVAPVTPSAPGMLTFTAAGLALSVRQAASTALNLASADLTCALSPGQNARLAAVPVAAAATHPSRPGGRPHAKGPATSGGGGVPPGCGKKLIHGGTANPVLGCAYLVGYADVQKLKGSALVGPGPNGTPGGAQLNVDTYQANIGCIPPAKSIAECAKQHGTIYTFDCSVGQLDYHNLRQFPPVTATFLNFGFVPVTAELQLSETTWPSDNPPTENRKCYDSFNKYPPVPLTSPVVSVFTIAEGAPPFTILNVGTTYLAIHISNISVNGVPLDPGPNCGIDQPMKTVLTGRGRNTSTGPVGYTISSGGPLTGTVTIPEFEHCGVGEDINPLLDASISGPANFQLITQGVLCTPHTSPPVGCPPNVPKPRRHAKS